MICDFGTAPANRPEGTCARRTVSRPSSKREASWACRCVSFNRSAPQTVVSPWAAGHLASGARFDLLHAVLTGAA